MLFNNLNRYTVATILMFSGSPVWADPYLYDSVCPVGPDGKTPGGAVSGGRWIPPDGKGGGEYFADKWNFAQCNCTSYVANRINMNGITFNNSSFGQHWGHGEHWNDAAQSAHMIVDTIPAVGSVAHWDRGEIGGGHGHVAYVEHVSKNTDGSVRSITISEYNRKLNDSTNPPMTVQPSDSDYPPRFIHFEIRVRGTVGWFPPVENCRDASQWFIVGTDSGGEKYRMGSSGMYACNQVPSVCYPN